MGPFLLSSLSSRTILRPKIIEVTKHDMDGTPSARGHLEMTNKNIDPDPISPHVNINSEKPESISKENGQNHEFAQASQNLHRF